MSIVKKTEQNQMQFVEKSYNTLQAFNAKAEAGYKVQSQLREIYRKVHGENPETPQQPKEELTNQAGNAKSQSYGLGNSAGNSAMKQHPQLKDSNQTKGIPDSKQPTNPNEAVLDKTSKELQDLDKQQKDPKSPENTLQNQHTNVPTPGKQQQQQPGPSFNPTPNPLG
jgi:hypothetical protein